MVRSLIQDNKQLVNARSQACLTSLHLAAANGRTAVVELLLANNADVGARDWHGATALQLAAKNGHSDILRLLKQPGPKGD